MDYLEKRIQPYDPSKVTSVEDALVALQGCSFQGRNLGNALEVLTNMVKSPTCFKVLTLSGAMIPAGMEELICQCIENKIVDCVVATGANIVHSIINHFDPVAQQYHFMGTDKVDDVDLYAHRINRVFDTYIPESGYQTAALGLFEILKKKFKPGTDYTIKPSELFQFIGENITEKSYLHVAAKHGVPIFCGATSDSELGLDMLRFREREGLNIVLDELGDITKFGSFIRKYEKHGTIILGGGVPRNWAQQIFPYLDLIYENEKYDGYSYSVRFHTAVSEDGGLSGCTISESISWGKYAAEAKHQSVWGDSTVYFPLLMTALIQRIKRLRIKIQIHTKDK